MLKSPGAGLCQNACGVVNEQKIFCLHQCSPDCSMNKFTAYISTDTFFIIYIYIYILHTIHHYAILWSSCRKLAWGGFELMGTEFRSDALTDWAIMPWVQLALRANFLQLHQFHLSLNIRFHFDYCLLQFCRVIHMSEGNFSI